MHAGQPLHRLRRSRLRIGRRFSRRRPELMWPVQAVVLLAPALERVVGPPVRPLLASAAHCLLQLSPLPADSAIASQGRRSAPAVPQPARRSWRDAAARRPPWPPGRAAPAHLRRGSASLPGSRARQYVQLVSYVRICFPSLHHLSSFFVSGWHGKQHGGRHRCMSGVGEWR